MNGLVDEPVNGYEGELVRGWEGGHGGGGGDGGDLVSEPVHGLEDEPVHENWVPKTQFLYQAQ